MRVGSKNGEKEQAAEHRALRSSQDIRLEIRTILLAKNCEVPFLSNLESSPPPHLTVCLGE